MSKIKILPENISNRIAAGEVIERPASVVKELVENAIDAGATRVMINIEKAGSKLISVSDNGSGMDADDALLCLEAHATSKIIQEGDIDRIRTFGFRGEAVPSIASISRFTLRTRQQNDMEGTEVIVHGGKYISTSPVGCAPGTEISVRDIFFNTPARKKFLRTQATEERHIQEAVFMLSLANPQTAFELTMDRRIIYSSSAHSDLIPRLRSFLGGQTADAMLAAESFRDAVKVSGFIAKHGFTRNTRREQRTFVNGRPVEALAIFRGIKEGYGGLVEKGRFPPVVLFIEMPPELVDVNVHPAKREVRFRKEYLITAVVAEAVRNALRESAAPTVAVDPSLSFKSVLDGASVGYELKNENAEFDFSSTRPARFNERELQTESFIEDMIPEPSSGAPNVKEYVLKRDEIHFSPENRSPASEEISTDETIEPPQASYPTESVQTSSLTLPGSGEMKIIGFLDTTYILATASTGLVIIDQHAAHERVLYEKILKSSEHETTPTQKLLFPITLELSRAETMFIEKYGKLFSSVGFDIELFSENTVLLNSIPAALSQDNAGGLISDLLSDLMLKGNVRRKVDMETVARAACIAAVKAHDTLSLKEAEALLKQMAECEMPFSCPHGRPTVINISTKELEKRFGRT